MRSGAMSVRAAPYDGSRRSPPSRRSIHLRCARSRDKDRPGISRRQAGSPDRDGVHNGSFRATGEPGYVEATERAFGADIDYGQVIKFHEAEPVGRSRYRPPRVVGAERSVIAGNPDPAHISTSLIERQN